MFCKLFFNFLLKNFLFQSLKGKFNLTKNNNINSFLLHTHISEEKNWTFFGKLFFLMHNHH